MELNVHFVLICVDREAVAGGGARLGRGGVVKSVTSQGRIIIIITFVTGITSESIDYKIGC